MSKDVREKLTELGWRQGICISDLSGVEQEFGKYSHIDFEEGDIFLVITQTCDLLHHDLDVEPYFEVLRLTINESEPSQDYIGGKNSRMIHFQDDLNGKISTLTAKPFERFIVDRELLPKLSPNGSISDENRRVINSWITKRYNRTAFPDSYDLRWKKRFKPIEKVIKRLKLVKDIYISIIPFEEIDDSDEYRIEIVLLMGHDDFNDPDTYAEYSKYLEQLEAQFSKCEGLDLEVIELRPDTDMTVSELESMRRWDYSYLSYREPDIHKLPTE